MIYLDNNATTQLHPDVAVAMIEYTATHYANPASQHRAGQRARQALEDAREQIGRLLGANMATMNADRVILTSGGTEANNLALFGLKRKPKTAPASGRVVISAIEHPSVSGPAQRLRELGCDVQSLPVSSDGVTLVDGLPTLLEEETRLVSVQLANNETGVLQPISEMVQLCQCRGVLIHTDAVQACGKMPVHFTELGVDAMTVAAHKFHGPVGIGALLVKHSAEIEPLFYGGFQQLGLRPGTESVALAIGMARALEVWQQEKQARLHHLTHLRNQFEEGLRHYIPGIVINGEKAKRTPQTSNVSFPNVDRQALLMALDFAGIACSSGSACASGSSEPSPVLLAMGLPPEQIQGSLRFSFGKFTTEADTQAAIDKIVATYRTISGR